MTTIRNRGLWLVLSLGVAGQAAGASTLTGGGVISRFAGNGIHDSKGDGGPASTASVAVRLLAVDTAGNLYISEATHTIRKVSATTGIITTIAGMAWADGFSGDGGPATAARFRTPMGIAVDLNDNLYIVDLYNFRVRKVSGATGVITTVAGNGGGVNTGDGGLATDASLEQPFGVAVDSRGNVYVTAGDVVRKVDVVTGIITTFAGTTQGFSGDGGPATAAQLHFPKGLTVDAADNLYIVDAQNCRIRMVRAGTGVITTIAGRACNSSSLDGDGGPAIGASLGEPIGVALDHDGNVYIGDSDHNHVRKITTATGIISTVVGTTSGSSGDGGPAINAQITFPSAVVIDAAGNLYVADPTNGVVRRVVPDDVQLVGDLDGDGKADIVAWHPGNGTWYWLTSSSGYTTLRTRQWGNSQLGDVPLLGDLDGDGKADLVVWRATTGTWYWLTSSSDYRYAAAASKQWGSPGQGDVPLLGDLDGDRKADLVIWRASTGTWYWLPSSGGYDYGSAVARRWGDASLGDRPLLGDLDGDGRADLVVWRASTGTFHCLTSRSGYTEGFGKQWGNAALGDIPLLADMDGDGLSDLVVWRHSTGTWFWLTAFGGFNYQAQRQRHWGGTWKGEVPLPGDYDGDGRADLAFWSATGTWSWLTSSGGYYDSSARAVSFVPQ